MRYQYHVRIGTLKTDRILYRTNNKQAAYRFAWGLVDQNLFPSIYLNGKFEETLLCRGDEKGWRL